MTENETIVRSAFAALAAGEVDAMLELVAPDLEWTYLDPSREDPAPQTCHGRDQLEYWVKQGSGWQIQPELQEIAAYGDRVLVVTHSAGLDERRARKTGDRNFHVVTVRGGNIAALRACRSRGEAVAIASGAGPGGQAAGGPAAGGPAAGAAGRADSGGPA